MIGLNETAPAFDAYCSHWHIQPNAPADAWWRAEAKARALFDGEHVYGHTYEFSLYWAEVVKTTPRGVQLRPMFNNRVFVLGTATRQRYVPTIELAVRDEIARRECHVSGCEARLVRARRLHSIAEQALVRYGKED